MALAIDIAPAESGWALRSPMLAAPLYFLSGGKAETAGRALGQRLAAAGHAAELVITIRSGEVAGRILFAEAA